MKFRKLVYAEEYEKGGEKKTAWKECGVLFFNENGNISIKLTSLPLSGQIMAFGPRPKSETPDGKGERYEEPPSPDPTDAPLDDPTRTDDIF